MTADHSRLPVQRSEMPPVRWDGHDLAAVQALTYAAPRYYGRPCAEVDRDWNLTLHGVPVPRDAWIAVCPHGVVTLFPDAPVPVDVIPRTP